jgi:NUDIX domain
MSHQEESNASTPLIAPSRWASGSFQLAAGCIMIQESTDKVVVVRDEATGRWFLPRGRKDIGETLEQAAFREGYEVRKFLCWHLTEAFLRRVDSDRNPCLFFCHTDNHKLQSRRKLGKPIQII